MELKLHRRYKGASYTIGDLYINGVKVCETLEDTDRGLNATMSEARIRELKVHGATAIPRGCYPVQMGVVSPKFGSRVWAKRWGGKLPRLLNVPGYEGVLIHTGNTAEQTEGCILPGWNKVKGQVVNSTDAFNAIMSQLIEAYYRDEKIVITID